MDSSMLKKLSDRKLGAKQPQSSSPVRYFQRSRSAFTLLEVILSMALTAVLMGIVGMAIDTHLRVVTIRRTNIEQAQLARALMRLIAKDLRNAIYQEPQDSSGSSFSSSSSSSGESGSNGSAEEGSEEELDSLLDDTLPSVPGIYGNQNELQIDTSGVPRLDEYQILLSTSGGLSEIPSDVKTVAYYLSTNTSQASDSVVQITADGEVGFIRRSLDRATTLWAMESGNYSALDSQGEALASEVTALEFSYYDGTEWADEWNSELRGGVPVAVQITLAIATSNDRDPRQGFTASLFNYTQISLTDTVYQLVVLLPAAQLDKIKPASSLYDNSTDSESSEGTSL